MEGKKLVGVYKECGENGDDLVYTITQRQDLLLVVEKNGKYVGIASMGDLARWIKEKNN